VREWVIGWVSMCVREWTGVIDWKRKWVDQWARVMKWVSEWVNEWARVLECVSKQLDESTSVLEQKSPVTRKRAPHEHTPIHMCPQSQKASTNRFPTMVYWVNKCAWATYSFQYLKSDLLPPKNGLIALWSATDRWYVVKYVSQKRNWSNNKSQWYNILVTFIFKFSKDLY